MSTPLGAAATRRPLHQLLDAVAVVLLVGLALLGLATTFGGWGFLVLGMGAAALGAALVLLTSRLPLAVPISVVPLVGLLLGGPLALRSGGLAAGVPDLQTLSDVLQGAGTGWGELLATLPPVDLAGAPALVPYLLGFLGGALGTGVAVRTRSAGLPLLPLLTVLVTVLLLRRPDGSAQDWYPVGFAALALVWTGARGLELAPDAIETDGWSQGRLLRTAGAAVVVVVALLLATGLTAGGTAPTGKTLRGLSGRAADVSGLDSPLGRFRTFTAQGAEARDNVHDKRLLTLVGAPAGSRVRIVTLDRYDGQQWRPGNDTMRDTLDDAFLRVDTRVDNGLNAPRIRVRVELAKAYRSAWVPLIGSLSSFRFLFANGVSKRDQLRYDPATSTAVVPLGLEPGNDYEFTAVLPSDELSASSQAWEGPVLDVAGTARVDPLISKVLSSPAPAMSKVFALARYLRVEGRYSDGAGAAGSQYRPGHDLTRLVDDFLLAPRPVGNDEQYAAAMALLANRLGVPARVVVGAVTPRDGIVRGEDVHAWVELRVADGSWRTLPTKTFMGKRAPGRDMTAAPPPQVPGLPPAEPEARPPDADLVQPETPAEDRARQQRAREQRGLLLRLLPWAVLLLLVLLVPAAKLVRLQRRRRGGRPSDRTAAAWSELLDRARDLGLQVPTGASRPAQARSLGLEPTLADRVDAGVFAAGEPRLSEVGQVWKAAGGALQALAHGQGWRRRAWAPFNPVTLVRRPRGRAD